MEPKEQFVEVDEQQIGLDRSNITHQGQIQLPGHELGKGDDGVPPQDANNYAEAEARSSTRRMVDSIKERKHDAGLKIRKTLHISRASDELELTEAESPILANSAEEKSNSRLGHKLPVPGKHTLKDFTHNPVDTVMSKVSNQGNQQIAANIATKEVSHGQDVDLVNASSAVERAGTEKERLLAIQNVSELLKERQSAYVRWTLDRHVTKVRILPRDTVTRKPRSAFEKRNPQGEVIVDWRAYGLHLLDYYAHRYGGQYVGYGSDPPTPSKETIMPNIERLIVATSQFQEFAMTTRRVYRWESPAETMKYLVMYILLWYFNLILPGLLSAILYFVAERRLHGNSMEDLREDIKHREDMERTALSLNEFIEKKGDKEWADELLQSIGPWLMVQLADMANFFESVRNFYEWRKPTRTLAGLGVFAVIILITATVPTWILLKSLSFSWGVSFFGLFPIAVNFPEYRLLVSPTKRLFWNIPTHAEWAIQHIQAEGTRFEANATSSPSALPIKTTPNGAKAHDYGFYKVHHEKVSGHLVVAIDSVRFVSNIGHVVHFTLPYNQIERLEKQNRIVTKHIPTKLAADSGEDLKLVNKAGVEWLLKDLVQRDEAFSQIVGFSQTTWQVVW